VAGYSDKGTAILERNCRWYLFIGRGPELDCRWNYSSKLFSEVLFEEQRALRWKRGKTVQPFWTNYHCGFDSRCTCRIQGSRSLESDAIFFFRHPALAKVLVVHVEFKHEKEPFLPGQPEGYPLRAACFPRTCSQRATVNQHDDWMTVLFCGSDALADKRLSSFNRVITHAEAGGRIAG